jgi:hypothetical protein
VIASARHWRILIATLATLMAAAFVAPRFIPAPGIEENRVLASAPNWPRATGEFESFRKAADAYVTDRFPPRAHLIGLLNRLRMAVGVSGSERVIVGRGGYLFWDDGTHLGAARGDPPMDDAATRRWLMHFAGRTEALRARGIPYLVVVGPTKETIYPEFAPDWLGRPSAGRPTIVLPRLAKATGAGDVLYLHPFVAESTRRGFPTYSRHDTHWNGYGAYAAYAALLGRLHALRLTDGPLPLSSFTKVPNRAAGPKDLAQMLGVANMVRVDFQHIANPDGEAKARLEYLTDKHDMTAPQVVETGNAGKPVLLMTRDSFSEGLLPLLLPHFSRIVLAHNQDGFWRQDLIDRFRPDVVIVETVEHGLPIAMNDGPAPSAAAAAQIDGVLRATGHLSGADPQFRPTAGPLLTAVTQARAAERCSFDAQSLTAADDRTTTVSVQGWIAEARRHATSPMGYLRLQGADTDLTIPIRVDGSRPDVAAAIGAPGAAMSGFQATAGVPGLPAGLYQLTVYRQSYGGLIACAALRPSVNRPAAGRRAR